MSLGTLALLWALQCIMRRTAAPLRWLLLALRFYVTLLFPLITRMEWGISLWVCSSLIPATLELDFKGKFFIDVRSISYSDQILPDWWELSSDMGWGSPPQHGSLTPSMPQFYSFCLRTWATSSCLLAGQRITARDLFTSTSFGGECRQSWSLRSKIVSWGNQAILKVNIMSNWTIIPGTAAWGKEIQKRDNQNFTSSSQSKRISSCYQVGKWILLMAKVHKLVTKAKMQISLPLFLLYTRWI